jgi:hypothetical protein
MNTHQQITAWVMFCKVAPFMIASTKTTTEMCFKRLTCTLGKTLATANKTISGRRIAA